MLHGGEISKNGDFRKYFSRKRWWIADLFFKKDVPVISGGGFAGVVVSVMMATPEIMAVHL